MTEKEQAVKTEGKARPAVKESESPAERRFLKDQLIKSGHFQNRRDLLEALLEDGNAYTRSDVEQRIEHYMKGKVN